jgi:REP element-mobilizing transposase RayT
LIFSTKNRENRISKELQTKLWPYMAGIARNHGFEAIEVGGIEDHAHTLLLLPPTTPLAKAVQILKSCSSKMAQRHGDRREEFRVAGRIRSVQRERLADGRCREVHRGPGGASREAQL